MEKEKVKADILILGDLICKQKLMGGGGKIYPCRKEELNEWFDYEEAMVVVGDVVVDSFDSGMRTVVVTGAVAAKGGNDGSL